MTNTVGSLIGEGIGRSIGYAWRGMRKGAGSVAPSRGSFADRLAKVAARSPAEVADRARVAALIRKARVQGDPGVPQMISRLEKGGLRVEDTNHYVGNPLREVDIEMASGAILQVKNLSSASQVIKQVQRTELATGQPTIGFVLQQHRAANKIVQKAGRHVMVTNNFDLLMDVLR